MKIKPVISTRKVEPPIDSREQIYRAALDRFRADHPQYDAVTLLSTRLGMGRKMLYAVLEGTRNITVIQQDMLFRECKFPEGYEMLRTLNFTPSVASTDTTAAGSR